MTAPIPRSDRFAAALALQQHIIGRAPFVTRARCRVCNRTIARFRWRGDGTDITTRTVSCRTCRTRWSVAVAPRDGVAGFLVMDWTRIGLLPDAKLGEKR